KTKVSYSDDDPDTIETGQLTVWSREICSDGSPMEIKVSGQTGQIDDGMTSEPVCGAAGTATFALITGNYTVEAICGTDTVRYEVVIDNKCTVLEIDMQNPPQESDYLPMVEGSSWTYADLSDVTSSHILKVEGSDVFEGRMFPRFVSNLGDTFYFRKDQGVYFEYRTLNFQDFVTNPPSIELVILHEDFDVGQSWESTVEDIILSNIPVKVMLRSTILRRDFIANIHGVDYPDCIEVNTEILFSSDGGNSFQAGNSFNRVFSKDRGIVYYYDINREVEWGVTSISINP
ncbi:MAG TPA: hypothetical protein VEC37_19840, partial [Bacillota bacterium]|nr:hypothetical protein [Bacillota bacterium]